MATLRPFRAWRPKDPSKAADVAAVPYDVVNRDEAAALADQNPLSFLRVSRPEIELPQDLNPYAPEVYARVRANWERLIASAPLIRDDRPRLYVYRLKQGAHVQTGIAATYSIDEYDQDLIRKHEKTRKEKEDDRTRHVLTLEAQTGPVFLTYPGKPEISALVEKTTQSAPLYDFVAPDRVTHTIWVVNVSAPLVAAFKSVPTLYIADGHHRAASASRARAEMRERNSAHTGAEDYNFVMAVAFPAEELRILPYHRVVMDLNGRDEPAFLQALETDFQVTPYSSAPIAPSRGEFAMYLARRWWNLKPHASLKTQIASKTPTERLDVSMLQEHVLSPLLDIGDPRSDKRIDFVGGIRGTDELERLVQSGRAQVAFALHPTTVEDLMTISDAGGIMPPKSTWFEPKLRDGLLSHSL